MPVSSDLLDLADRQDYPSGALYIVATPIGNLADITVRALHVLTLCDRIAAEDTRTSSQMLGRYGIAKPMLAAHEHNEHEAAQRIVSCLQAGERVAYISDAGTPGLSDPGARLCEAVRAAGFRAIPLPGASALLGALSVAGPWASPFTFIGFLPAKPRQRQAALDALAQDREALVFYEAPHRVLATLDALRQAFGTTRRVLVARELTKLHETVIAGTLEAAPGQLAGEAPRGEYVLVVEGAPETVPGGVEQHDALLRALLAEIPVSGAARVAARLTGATRDALYARALALADDAGNKASDD